MQPLVSAFRERLGTLRWKGDAVHIELRSAITDAAQFQAASSALVMSRPDVIVALGSRAVRALRDETRTIPVVFTLVADPVAQGLVQSLARPGGNLTGVTNFEFSFAGKWVEALKEINPRLARVLLLVNPQNSGTLALALYAEGLGPVHGVEMSPAPVVNLAQLETAIGNFAQRSDGGVIVFPDGLVVDHRVRLIELVNEARLPTIYPFRAFANAGGLISYGIDFVAVYRLAAEYASRILRGEKPEELPIQAPNTFEMVINLKSAARMGLTIPPTLLARADEVIE
jgi:putative ABC transport system substrate-binding protein